MSLQQKRSDETRAAILSAAQQLFAKSGFDRTTVREIAQLAGIDAALVIRYFGSKEALFADSVSVEVVLPNLDETPPEKKGEALTKHFLYQWESSPAKDVYQVLLRCAAANEHAAERARTIFATQILSGIAKIKHQQNPRQCAGLIASQFIGLALCRYIIQLPPIVAMTHEEIIRYIGPTIQSYMDAKTSDE